MTTALSQHDVLGARLAMGWTRLYTGRLASEIAAGRRDEIAADLHDHLEAARRAGSTNRAASRAIASRMALGVPADISWRRHQLRDQRRAVGKENAMARPAPDQQDRLATIAGVVVVSWILLIAVASGVSSLANGWPTAWTSVAIVVGVGGIAVVGLVRLLRGHADGAFPLAAAAIGSTVFFVWFPVIPVIGAAVAVGLVTYGVRARRQSPAAQQVAS